MFAKKQLGQHFLTAPSIAKKIADSANLGKDTTVLEIGPGKGILTRELLQQAGNVIAIEKDADMLPLLREEYKEALADGRLVLVEGDALSTSLAQYGLKNLSYALVANIPYYITGELLRHFLSGDTQPHTLVFLMQKEVAERIARSEKGSLLSISVAVYGTATYGGTVKAGSFSPKPNVDSAIVIVHDISKKFFDTVSEDSFFELLKTGFSQKRKQLVNNLSSYGNRERLERALYRSGIALKARPEELTPENWKKLYRELR
ncbi:ribosomal RNA small subunit methyltransferase A [Candidatus Kaiserbacteria bacterium CG10_big_fil_rev_8_21_14_0_10_49_17]|uniref:Ribosomal RNA small subunit methyltransferase A n=1 Tax=Candidatus Kaiserbacteria bacterium CG10_big_fil_rev_8_21_14_0_10_49_17 TaxID=1974609 RepID=A0A2M6WEA6_9BACT|nr:MAG: ribosomal RNA small subunit methyltransferase A [Candidatus Kaiserbacteria bacterium CG10_big_fil_rev_8_21_14_0_10_49_17]